MLKVIICKIFDFVFSSWILFVSLLALCIYQTSGVDFFLIDFCGALILTSLVALLSNRVNFSLGFTLFFGYIILMIHQTKMRFWGNGFEAADFNFLFPMIKYNREIFIEYYSTLIPTILQFLLIIIILSTIFVRSKKIVNIKNRFLFILIRLSMICISLLLLYALKYSLMQHNSRLNSYLNNKYLDKLNLIKKSSTTYGYDGLNQNVGIYGSIIFGMKFSSFEMIFEPFKDISTSKILNHVQNKFIQKPKKLHKLPDIISVLHESTFDPAEFNLNNDMLDNLKFLSKDKFTIMHGKTNVSIFGGNSQNSEFEAITGLDTKLFLWSGMAPNFSLINNIKNSLVSECKKAGYEVILIYPVPKKFTNAENAAKKLGVDKIYDIKDFPEFLSKKEIDSSWPIVEDEVIVNIVMKILEQRDAPQNIQNEQYDEQKLAHNFQQEQCNLQQNLINNEDSKKIATEICNSKSEITTSFEKNLDSNIIDQVDTTQNTANQINAIEVNKNASLINQISDQNATYNLKLTTMPLLRKPLLILVSTMSNHGQHANQYSDKFHLTKKFGVKIAAKLNDYFDRIIKTDHIFTKFSNYLMHRKHPTVLVQYGDHKPSFEGKMLKLLKILNQEDKKYQTFFNIRANFATEKIAINNLDLFFLPSVILDLIGIEKNQFFKVSSYIRNLCQGSLYKCNLKNINQDYENLIFEYKKLSVEQIFDLNNK